MSRLPALYALACAFALPECSASQDASGAARDAGEAIVVKLKGSARDDAAGFAARMSRLFPGLTLEPIVGDVFLAKFDSRKSLAGEDGILAGFLETGLVEAAERDGAALPPVLAAEPAEAKDWFLDKIQAPVFWGRSKGSRSIKVLVCDTGIEANHPDLRGNVGAGRNFVDGGAETEPTGNGHGTRVAGIIGAQGGHAGSGASGVNWEVQIIPGKISNAADGRAVHTDTAKCVKWGADQGIKVVNLSFSGVVDSLAVQEAAGYLHEKGGVLIVAAGNAGARRDFPDDPNMLVVGGTNALDWKPPAYNTGRYVDLSAPASALYTTDLGGKHVTTQGTSLSAAIVSGAAALMLSVRPGLSADQLTGLILGSTVDLGAPGRDEAFGVGRLDLRKALELLTGGERASVFSRRAPEGPWTRLLKSGGSALSFD